MQDHPSDREAFYTLFETPIGLCGLAWTGRGIAGLQLPEGDAARTRPASRNVSPGSRRLLRLRTSKASSRT